MSKEYTNNDFSQSSDFPTDAQLEFECRQAFLRKHFVVPEVNAEWNSFRESISPDLNVSQQAKLLRKGRTRYFAFGVFAGVAAALLVLVLLRGYNNYLNQQPVTVFVAEQRSNEITIDTDNVSSSIVDAKAINDPHSGEIIDLNKADFRKTSVTAMKTKTVTTPYGKDYRVILNDGTEVVMNADSKLTFPTRFSGNERVVSLEGEAYFKVAKNPNMPFIVKTRKMDTKALGTEFNVKAYKNSDPHVTLIEGIVEVNIPLVNKKIRMEPNDDLSLTNKTLNIRNVDTEYYIQWKDGFFYYDNVSLGEIMSDIGRWYNVNIEIDKPALMDYHLHFVVNRDAKIDEVVENLNNFGYLDVVKFGNKISISTKKTHN